MNGALAGENAEEVEFDLPNYADDDDTASGAIPMVDSEIDDSGEKPAGQRIHDYKIDTLRRRYPVDIHGNRVSPNNRRPEGVTIVVWKRLKEEDKKALWRLLVAMKLKSQRPQHHPL